MKVPAPTFCPECRLIRRLVLRNERILYKRECNLCKKNIISIYHQSVPFPVYCLQCWYGDGWDPVSFGRDYDFSRPFFEQWKGFSDSAPRLALWHRNAINSDYSSFVGESKNVYLSVSVVLGSENVFYSKFVDKSTDIVDCLNIKDGQILYEDIEGEKNYNCQHLFLSKNCIDSFFLVDCTNCSNCLLSHNLRNKEFYIRNVKYSKEEYFKELEKINLKSRASRKISLEEFEKIKIKSIYRFANIVKSVNSTGNNLLNVKNCKNCFEVYDAENLKYCYRVLRSFKDSMDTSYGMKSELIYEYITGANTDYNVKFSSSGINYVQNAEYTDCCINCNNIFGCISLKNKENAVFNKIYTKEEFFKLREKIIDHMNEMPYVDQKGRVYKYGEFFPIELSPFAYNETLAQEIAPITEKQASAEGYPWRKSDQKNFKITIPAEDIPDNINEVSDKILNEVLGCAHEGKCEHQCNEAFRITNYELNFYKKHSIPLPILCQNCRYYERSKVMPSLKLWHRKCMKKGCENEFETSYAPNRPEIIYCERCYQQEVY
jgi:hypothetical protein